MKLFVIGNHAIMCDILQCAKGVESGVGLLGHEVVDIEGPIKTTPDINDLTDIIQIEINEGMESLAHGLGIVCDKLHYHNVAYLFFLGNLSVIDLITKGKYVFTKVIPIYDDIHTEIKITLTYTVGI